MVFEASSSCTLNDMKQYFFVCVCMIMLGPIACPEFPTQTFPNRCSPDPRNSQNEIYRDRSRSDSVLMSVQGNLKRVVSKRVVLADVPCAEVTFPRSLSLQCYPGRRTQKNRNEGTFAKTTLLQTHPVVSSRSLTSFPVLTISNFGSNSNAQKYPLPSSWPNRKPWFEVWFQFPSFYFQGKSGFLI